MSASAWLAIDTATDIASVAAGRHVGDGGPPSDSGAHVEGARRVPENFAYTSDTNTDWLDADGLGRLIKTGTP